MPHWDVPVITLMAQEHRDPYRVLIATLLSLRTQDQTTGPAAQRLFALADTPEAMLKLDQKTIERAIYPVGFYRNKAEQVLAISQRLLDEFDGQVPDDIDVLTSFHGVGRKTANLVLAEGYNIPGHLRRYARAPHFQPLGLRQDEGPPGHRDGAAQEAAARPVDHLQPHARGLGPALLQADLADVQPVSGGAVLQARRGAALALN